MHEALVARIEQSYGNFIDQLNELCKTNNLSIPTVIAVSKTRSVEVIQAAIDVGINDFGENYAQEMVQKAEIIKSCNWHFIGNLQRRNAKSIVPHTYILHTIDSIKLVNRLTNLNYEGKALIQVNISQEESKSGIKYDKNTVLELRDHVNTNLTNIKGLMAIGRSSWSHEMQLDNYAEFVDFGKSLGFTEFSLGMSGDWRSAVLAGATFLRIGSIIFGKR